MARHENAIIRCHEITKFYPVGDGVFALRDVSLVVHPGEFVLIQGPSGSGKTTLLNILGGIDRPSHGEVIMKGRKFSRMREDDLAVLRRTELGFVFQFFNLIPELTAWENISLPLKIAGVPPAQIYPRVSELLSRLGLAGRANHYPIELSGGEQQRVAIARALAPRPAVILADEPTGNLDTKTAGEVMELFQDLNRRDGQTLIVATHASEFQRYATRAVSIRDGRILDRSGPAACAGPKKEDSGRHANSHEGL